MIWLVISNIWDCRLGISQRNSLMVINMFDGWTMVDNKWWLVVSHVFCVQPWVDDPRFQYVFVSEKYDKPVNYLKLAQNMMTQSCYVCFGLFWNKSWLNQCKRSVFSPTSSETARWATTRSWWLSRSDRWLSKNCTWVRLEGRFFAQSDPPIFVWL